MTESESPITLTDGHRRQIVEAGRRMRGIRRAISFARFSAGTTMLFGVLSLAFAAIGMAMGTLDGVATLLGAGLVLVALNEYRGAVLLGRLHLGAPLRLAAGQVALGLVIIGYCVWRLLHADQTGSQVQELGPEMASVIQGMATLVYVLVIGATILFQGSAAVYYLTRKGLVLKYTRQTPGWIVEFDRLRGGG